MQQLPRFNTLLFAHIFLERGQLFISEIVINEKIIFVKKVALITNLIVKNVNFKITKVHFWP